MLNKDGKDEEGNKDSGYNKEKCSVVCQKNQVLGGSMGLYRVSGETTKQIINALHHVAAVVFTSACLVH